MRPSFLRFICFTVSIACIASLQAGELETQFQQPPQSAKPRTWWHWVSGNVSSEGITADLQAMHDIGLGGCQLFTVDQSDVHGPVKFMSPEWRGFVKQALGEADKLGLEVSIEGCDGWSESGGPWIKPEQGMQHIVWTETNVTGGADIILNLPQPNETLGFYRDIAVLAFPAVQPASLLRENHDFAARTGMEPRMNIPFVDETLPADQAIDPAKIINLSGKTKWTAPAGQWTLVRIGHTGTGATTHPSTTPGLECDKLSAAAVRYHFEQMYGPIIADSPKEAGRALHSILLDSWECGCGNWTALMPKEFARRHGYDLTQWLPVFARRVVKDSDSTQRFLWDYRRTIADLLTENHYGVAREFAHEHGMKLYAEAPGIGLPTVADNLACKGQTDIPMGEFWIRSLEDNVDDPKEAASAAHIYGKPVVATESFTATPNVASWVNDPYSLKQLGDMEFCLGVNRFIFHRYAHQPWNDRVPGMSMGPWGINFERSNTWWKDGTAWIDYLTRCQYLLQQGRFIADVLYFYGEGAAAEVNHRSLRPHLPAGYDYDVCNAEILLNQMAVDHGEIVLKSGMRYRVLVLPDTDRMTLPVLKKIRTLVRDGATVYGWKPAKSPSLADHDAEVRKLAAEVWGTDDDAKVNSHTYGKGRVIWGDAFAKALPPAPDFQAAQPGMKFIHRRTVDADIYFVSNQHKTARTVDCSFRVSGKVPEFWHPDSGGMETAALYKTSSGVTTVPIEFDPIGSVFVVFRKATTANHAVAVSKDGKPLAAPEAKITVEIVKATYGVPGDATKSKDVTPEVRRFVAAGNNTLSADNSSFGGDPAYGMVKTLTVDYVIDGKTTTASAREGEDLALSETAQQPSEAAKLSRAADGSLSLETSAPGNYEISLDSGKKASLTVAALPQPLVIEGQWNVSFPPKLGAPATAVFDHLMSWTDSPDADVKYFSGTATYEKQIEIPAEYIGPHRKLILDLGGVKNLAEVMLNGKSLGILWKEPFSVDVTAAAKVGTNKLVIRVTNLWPNRMIGDQNAPEAQRITWSSVHPYKADSRLLPSGLLGPVRLVPIQTVTVAVP